MFGKTLFEELKDASVSNEKAYVSYCNNGEIKTDNKIVTEKMTSFYLDDFIGTIKFIFRDAAEYYARQNPFDYIKLDLELGLVYNQDDVDEENKIKENAEPIKDIVRCYTSGVTSYLNGEKSNEHDYYYDRKGFINYNNFVSKMKKDGIAFEGPKTFEDFKNAILAGETFDVSIYADLREKDKTEEVKQEVKQDVEEPKKETPKKLTRKPFFSKLKKTTNL